jgi:hypothetical protein
MLTFHLVVPGLRHSSVGLVAASWTGALVPAAAAAAAAAAATRPCSVDFVYASYHCVDGVARLDTAIMQTISTCWLQAPPKPCIVLEGIPPNNNKVHRLLCHVLTSKCVQVCPALFQPPCAHQRHHQSKDHPLVGELKRKRFRQTRLVR